MPGKEASGETEVELAPAWVDPAEHEPKVADKSLGGGAEKGKEERPVPIAEGCYVPFFAVASIWPLGIAADGANAVGGPTGAAAQVLN